MSGGPSVKPRPAVEDVDTVRRIQKALAALGYLLPLSFQKGTGGEPDGAFGSETYQAVMMFQRRAFPGQPGAWDGRVGQRTLEKMDSLLPRQGQPNVTPTPVPPPAGNDFICGPDVTDQVAATWKQIQDDFRKWTRTQKVAACNSILIPLNNPVGLVADLSDAGPSVIRGIAERIAPKPAGGSMDRLINKIRAHAKIDQFDTLPLFQAGAGWLRKPPVYDDTVKGPCATPSSSDFGNADNFAAGHEDVQTCSNTVQVAGKCWLAGSVNYGTFGIMVRECSDFAANDHWGALAVLPSPFDAPLKFNPLIRSIYSLAWAKTLIQAYKKFGGNPEKVKDPVAWTEATFNKGPRGTPDIPGNRPKCKCSCGCKGDVVTWDYVWEPWKPRLTATWPEDV
jgi:peptidoglycan hydrolase-like protein with peptidoglycan-binding domain